MEFSSYSEKRKILICLELGLGLGFLRIINCIFTSNCAVRFSRVPIQGEIKRKYANKKKNRTSG